MVVVHTHPHIYARASMHTCMSTCTSPHTNICTHTQTTLTCTHSSPAHMYTHRTTILSLSLSHTHTHNFTCTQSSPAHMYTHHTTKHTHSLTHTCTHTHDCGRDSGATGMAWGPAGTSGGRGQGLWGRSSSAAWSSGYSAGGPLAVPLPTLEKDLSGSSPRTSATCGMPTPCNTG